MVAFDNVVDEEDLCVAESWGGDTELAGAQSFEENCATLLSEARLNWGRCLYDILICIYIFIMSSFSE